MTEIRGAQFNQDTGTLDLTRVKFSLGQLIAAFVLIGGMIAGGAIMGWRVNSHEQSIAKIADAIEVMARIEAQTEVRLNAVEKSQDNRDREDRISRRRGGS